MYEDDSCKKNYMKIVGWTLAGLAFSALIIGLLAFYVIFWKDMRTISSIKKVSKNAYYEMDYVSDYYFDDFLKEGASSDKELGQFILKKILKGFPTAVDTKQGFACSTFSMTDTNGDYIFGRNLDWSGRTLPVLVHTKPNNGYESFSLANVKFLSGECDLESFTGKLEALCLPYLPMDGINEKGVSVAVLMLDDAATNQNTGKVSITTSTAIRMILDKAANVDEALNLMQQYDMHASHAAQGANVNFHFTIADASGKAAIIEYTNDQMKIIKKDKAYQICTNFKVSDYTGQEITPSICFRYAAYNQKLNEVNGVLSSEDAFEMLKSQSLAKIRSSVGGWSVLYNNSNLNMVLSTADNMNKNYNYSFEDKIGIRNRVIIIDWFIIAIIPVLMIFAGIIRKNKMTMYGKGVFVIKSKNAMKSNAGWFFAQEYLGKTYALTGLIMLVISEAAVFFFRRADIEILTLVFIITPICQLASCIIPFLITEKEIAKKLKMNIFE